MHEFGLRQQLLWFMIVARRETHLDTKPKFVKVITNVDGYKVDSTAVVLPTHVDVEDQLLDNWSDAGRANDNSSFYER